ncbi:hypothetical protein [uncultured Cytophaga sp.]|uniref:hypothetical protein n=1 Tax=uncultured Cytophaga sp. TaxID=160238 RepID=UPI0026304C0F|nr:hypothetical protein [uncultured Cytophaga sp.]
MNLYQKESSDLTLETYYNNFIKAHPRRVVLNMIPLTMYAVQNTTKVKNRCFTDGSPSFVCLKVGEFFFYMDKVF